VVREDPDGTIRRYAHLGTGNYNPSTARYYTDFSLLTCDEAITASVNDVFNFLTAYAEQPNYKPLFVAPRDLAKNCIALIDREARNAKRRRPARIIVKMNALVDPPVIQALYRASQAGVEIDLIVRGQCALVPGLRGLSSRIRVRSIVGRFLEHSRIFYFENAGEPEIYLGSADWMQRNLYERVEVLFPLKDEELRRRIKDEILPAYLADTRAARLLGADGKFSRTRASRNGRGISVQEHLMRAAQQATSPFDAHAAKVRSKLLTPVYTVLAGGVVPENRCDESASQDSLNASV
jgi:polyphosphate kinase